MIHGFYQSAGGMLVNEHRQDVLANNLANSDTIGFKRDLAVFAERVPEARKDPDAGFEQSEPALSTLGGGVWLGPTTTDFSDGPHIQTNNPTDAALAGSGFFVVESDGQTLYTRDGRFQADAVGQLRSATDGAAVLGAGGGPILVNPVGPAPTFDKLGRVLQGGDVIGQLAIADFEDYSILRKVGASRFDAGEVSPRGAVARVEAGYVEGSSAEAISSMTEMMVAARAYQLNARMVQLQDESAGRLISMVART